MIGARQAPADSLFLHIVYSNFGGMKREEKVLRGFGPDINLYTPSRHPEGCWQMPRINAAVHAGQPVMESGVQKDRECPGFTQFSHLKYTLKATFPDKLRL